MSNPIVEFEKDFFVASEARCGIVTTAAPSPPPGKRRVLAAPSGVVGTALLSISIAATPFVLPTSPEIARGASVSAASQLRGVIVRTDDVCGGDARVDNTRIPVWTLVEARQLGKSENEILIDFPTLTLDALRAAWAYYDRNRAEVQREIRAQRDA